MLMSDSDVDQSVSQWRVGRAFGSDVAVVTCTSGRDMMELMLNESRLLELFAVARSRDSRLEERTIAKFAVPTQNGLLWVQGKLCAV